LATDTFVAFVLELVAGNLKSGKGFPKASRVLEYLMDSSRPPSPSRGPHSQGEALVWKFAMMP
jgi:hypothetical protein